MLESPAPGLERLTDARVWNLVRGGGLAGSIASLAFWVLLLIPGVDATKGPILAGGLIGAVLFGLAPKALFDRWFYAGSWAAATLVLAIGLVYGNVWLFLAGVAGGVGGSLAPRLADSVRVSKLNSPWLATAVLLLVAALMVPLVMGGGTLDHDEAAYALKPKGWLEGTPTTGYGFHRGPAMWVYGYVVQGLGGQEPALRALGVVSLLGLAAAVFWLATSMGTKKTGILATILVVASPPLLRRSTEFLSDIPAAALLVLCMGVVWREFGRRELPTYRLLWLVPLAWLAFYFRFQSLLSFALVAGTILALWWPKVRARPGPLIAVAGLGVIGLVPHALFAITLTGSPIGILTWVTGTGRDFTGDGLIGYLGIFGWTMGLFLGPTLVMLAGWWLFSVWRDRTGTKALFLLAPAFAQVVALGVLGEAHERFVFFPYSLLAIAGTLAFQAFQARSSPRALRASAMTAAVLVSGVLSLSVFESRRYVEARALLNEPLELAAYEVQALADGGTCGVVTSYVPQMTLYSECPTYNFLMGRPQASIDRLPGSSNFAVLIEGGKRQPVGDDLAAYEEMSVAQPLVVSGERDSAVILIIDD